MIPGAKIARSESNMARLRMDNVPAVNDEGPEGMIDVR